ncbi:MAG: PolC-type DNA polymerase III [Fusobacteria bacterium]|nr:PolC-type DNA polymerase III [Fusobacteriota bacterium]
MEKVIINPDKDLLKNMSIFYLEISELEIQKYRHKLIVRLSVSCYNGLKEVEPLKSKLVEKFGKKLNIQFDMSYKEGVFQEDRIENILDYIITSLEKNSYIVKAFLGLETYRIDRTNCTVGIQVKHPMAKEQLEQSNIPRALEEELSKILHRKYKIYFLCGDFSDVEEAMDLESERVLAAISKENDTQSASVRAEKKEGGDTFQPSSDGDFSKYQGRSLFFVSKKDFGEILGKKIDEEAMEIATLFSKTLEEVVVFEGKVFGIEFKTTKSGKTLMIGNITDGQSAVSIKSFMDKPCELKNGAYVKIKGKKNIDTFEKNKITREGEHSVFVQAINAIEAPEKIERMDSSAEKRVELHLHTKMSELDSVIEVYDIIDRAAKWGHKGVAITDHGVAYGFPTAFNYAKKNYPDFKVILGIEAYVVNDDTTMVLNARSTYLESETYVVFDIETTGFNPIEEYIIEIGAVKINRGKVIERFNEFVKPGKDIPHEITNLTGITSEMVGNALTIELVLPQFLEFASDCVLIAHNANFDMSFIKEKASRYLKREVLNPVIDTLQWSRNINKELRKHNLKALAAHYKVSLENHHRASDDAEATGEIFQKMLNQLAVKDVHKLDEIDNAFETNISAMRPNHMVILVQNREGLRNLYELISKSHIEHFHRTPKIPKSLLMKMRSGLILGSACSSGELIQTYLKNRDMEELKRVAKQFDYLEIQADGNNNYLLTSNALSSVEEIHAMNKVIVDIGRELEIPVVATGDAHYLNPEDKIFRDILLWGKGMKDIEFDEKIYFKTTEEMLAEFSYLSEKDQKSVVIENPSKIFDLIEVVPPIPKGFYPPKIEGAEEQVREMTIIKAKEIYGDPIPEHILVRIERELQAIIGNGFSVLYLIAHKLVKKSLDAGYIVGSRGSVGSSIVAYMMNITEVNALYPHYICKSCKYSEFLEVEGSGVDLPAKECPKCGQPLKRDGHSIPFEVFMGFDGDKVPDIDLNFSGEYQATIHRYTEELFGKTHVFKAGTISTLAEQNALGYAMKYVEERGLKKTNADLLQLSQGCVNVRKTTGQHPGGMIVVPSDHEIYEFTPVQKPANKMDSDSITTHFDYHVMDEQLVKLDILGHDDPTTIRILQKELKRVMGIDLAIEDIPLGDEKTLSIFHSTEALGVTEKQINSPVGTFGIPEFGTRFVREMLIETRPSIFAELVRISGLSHGTDVWLNNAQNYFRQGVAKLSEVISVRDDIMNYLIDHKVDKSTAFQIMEFVRKGQPSKNKEKWEQFAKLMQDHDVQPWYIESCEKIKYMFPKGHAVAYVVMAMRIAYFKVHYPLIFYSAFLSRKVDDFDYVEMFGKIENIGVNFAKLESDMGRGFTVDKDGVQKPCKPDVKNKAKIGIFEILVEMHYRNIELLPADLYSSLEREFRIEEGKIRCPLVTVNGLGETVAQKIVEEREKGAFLSVEELMQRAKINSTVVELLKSKGVIQGLQEFNQQQLF